MPSILTSGGNVVAEGTDYGGTHFPRLSPDIFAVTGQNESRLEDDGIYKEQISRFFPVLDRITLGTVCACSMAVALICVMSLMWFIVKRRRQKLLSDLCYQVSEESKIIKSAPASRIVSPKLNKRKSCPEALSVSTSKPDYLHHSLTTDPVPKLHCQQERCQSACSHNVNNGYSCSKIHQENKEITSIKHDPCKEKSLSKENDPYGTCYSLLWFSVLYDMVIEHLHVNLVKVEHLPGRGKNQRPRDPFVKIFLLPDDTICRVSKIKKNTLNPVFNETHTFQITAAEVKKSMLRFSVYDIDNRRVLHSLGHMVVSMQDLNLSQDNVLWSKLEPTILTATSVGELQFSLTYIPSREKIKIAIFNAKNLNYKGDNNEMDVYARVQLYYGHRCHRVKHTVANKGGTEIIFNKSFTFTTSTELLDTCNMRIFIMLTSPRNCKAAELEYGRVVIGPFMFARGDELVHWQQMLSQPGLSITNWHSLTGTTSFS